MTNDRLTAARAREMAQTVENSAKKTRVNATLGVILGRIADAANDEKFSLEYSFIPPCFDLVRDIMKELATLKYKATLRDSPASSTGTVEGFRPHEKVLTIEW